VKNARFGSHAGLPASDEEYMRDAHEPRTYPTPAEFIAQVGRVIAFCLSLAVLAHVIVAVVGAQ